MLTVVQCDVNRTAQPAALSCLRRLSIASCLTSYLANYRAGYLQNVLLPLIWCVMNRTMHDLAITYHFQSPWENHHLAASLTLSLKPEHSFLAVSLIIARHYDSAHDYSWLS